MGHTHKAFKYCAYIVDSHSFPLSGLGADLSRAVQGFHLNLTGTSGSSTEHRLNATNTRQSDRLDVQGSSGFISCGWRGRAWEFDQCISAGCT